MTSSSSVLRLAALLIVLMCISSTKSVPINCAFKPANNHSLVQRIYKYFDEDSGVKVVEYVITLNGTSKSFDWSSYSDEDTFQPWRWFRTQGSGSSRLLLAFYNYYGLFKHYLNFDSVEIPITLTPTPEGCMDNLARGEIDNLLRAYLLRDFDINPKAVRHPYTKSDTVNLCSMYLDDINGWGHLTYRCCKYDDDADNDITKLECHSVYNDGWVWSLRVLIMIFTIVFFLYIPSFIPRRHVTEPFHYTPNDDIRLIIIKTEHPEKYLKVRNVAIIEPYSWLNLDELKWEAGKLEKEVVYTARIKCMDCRVNGSNIASKHHSPVSFLRSFFDAFIFCKIQHDSALEECCNTSICGEMCFGGGICPPWLRWLRAVRIITIMIVVALPAMPLLYTMTADDLNFQDLDKAHAERGLTAFNMYPGLIISRVFVGIVGFMYVLNTVILVIDCATDGKLVNLYSSVLNESQTTSKFKRKFKTWKVVIRRFFRPLQKYGFYIFPLWLIVTIVFLPLTIITIAIINSPMARIITHAFKTLLQRMNIISQTRLEVDERMALFCKNFWFFISLIFVCLIFTVGINLIVHAIAMIIVEIVVDSSIVYKTIPMVFFLLFYIRDAFGGVKDKYKRFLQTIIKSLVDKDGAALEQETRTHKWPLEKNKMFEVDVSVEADQDGDGKGIESDIKDTPGFRTPLFEVWRGDLWIRLRKVLLLLSKEEIVSTSKQFLFQVCDMECSGVPGTPEENFWKAMMEFLKIAAFLMFVFVAVMAYGSIYSISPTNHLFITLVTGVVPLVLKNVSKENSDDEFVDTSSYRYHSQLNKKIRTFVQTWELQDLMLDTINPLVDGTDILEPPEKSELTTARMANYRQGSSKAILSTLVLSLKGSGNYNMSMDEYGSRPNSPTKRRSSRKVHSSVNICCGSDVVKNNLENKTGMEEKRNEDRTPKIDRKHDFRDIEEGRGYDYTDGGFDNETRTKHYAPFHENLEYGNEGRWKKLNHTYEEPKPLPPYIPLANIGYSHQQDKNEEETLSSELEVETGKSKTKRKRSSRDFRRLNEPPAFYFQKPT